MKYLFAGALVVCLVPFVQAAEEENPYKKAKVGDWNEYKLTTAVGGLNIEAKMKAEVTAKTDKEATVKATTILNGKEVQSQESKIDLTKPYDPASAANLPAGSDVKVTKDGDGKEKIKLGGKEYDCTWTKLKITGKANNMDIDANAKVWVSKDVPLDGLVKMEMNSKLMGMDVKVTMELTGSGSK